MKVERSGRLSLAESRVGRARVEARVGGGRRAEHERAVPRHPHSTVARVDDDRALVARPDDVRHARIGVGRAVDAAGQRAGEVDVAGLRQHVRQVCGAGRRRQRQQQQRQQRTNDEHRQRRHSSRLIHNVTTVHRHRSGGEPFCVEWGGVKL